MSQSRQWKQLAELSAKDALHQEGGISTRRKRTSVNAAPPPRYSSIELPKGLKTDQKTATSVIMKKYKRSRKNSDPKKQAKTSKRKLFDSSSESSHSVDEADSTDGSGRESSAVEEESAHDIPEVDSLRKNISHLKKRSLSDQKRSEGCSDSTSSSSRLEEKTETKRQKIRRKSEVSPEKETDESTDETVRTAAKEEATMTTALAYGYRSDLGSSSASIQLNCTGIEEDRSDLRCAIQWRDEIVAQLLPERCLVDLDKTLYQLKEFNASNFEVIFTLLQRMLGMVEAHLSIPQGAAGNEFTRANFGVSVAFRLLTALSNWCVVGFKDVAALHETSGERVASLSVLEGDMQSKKSPEARMIDFFSELQDTWQKLSRHNRWSEYITTVDSGSPWLGVLSVAPRNPRDLPTIQNILCQRMNLWSCCLAGQQETHSVSVFFQTFAELLDGRTQG